MFLTQQIGLNNVIFYSSYIMHMRNVNSKYLVLILYNIAIFAQLINLAIWVSNQNTQSVNALLCLNINYVLGIFQVTVKFICKEYLVNSNNLGLRSDVN